LNELDFFAEQNVTEPFEILKELRERAPVFKVHQAKFGRDQYVVTTYELVDRVLKRPEIFSSSFGDVLTGGQSAPAEVQSILAEGWPEVGTMFTSDEPDHKRLRSLASEAFAPSRLKRMATFVEAAVEELIDDFVMDGKCDFGRQFAALLPIRAIAAIMGIDSSHHDDLNQWTIAQIRRNGQMASVEQQISDARQIAAAKRFIAGQIADRRENPKDDLISDLVSARETGTHPMTDHELMSTVLLLLIAGAETTGTALTSAMVRLLREPETMTRVENDLRLVPKVLEEVLRLDSPGSSLWRIAKEDVSLGGVQIPRGGVVMLRIDSANRDEAVFANAEIFDIDRRSRLPQLSFGSGIHFCIGFRLAKQEMNFALPAILRRLKNIRLIAEESDLSIRPSVQIRCYKKVVIAFEPGPRVGNIGNSAQSEVAYS
jgi:cytochrome P450